MRRTLRCSTRRAATLRDGGCDMSRLNHTSSSATSPIRWCSLSFTMFYFFPSGAACRTYQHCCRDPRLDAVALATPGGNATCLVKPEGQLDINTILADASSPEFCKVRIAFHSNLHPNHNPSTAPRFTPSLTHCPAPSPAPSPNSTSAPIRMPPRSISAR